MYAAVDPGIQVLLNGHLIVDIVDMGPLEGDGGLRDHVRDKAVCEKQEFS